MGPNPLVTAQEATAGLDLFNPAIGVIDPARFASVDDVLAERRASTGRVLVIDGTGLWEGAGTGPPPARRTPIRPGGFTMHGPTAGCRPVRHQVR